MPVGDPSVEVVSNRALQVQRPNATASRMAASVDHFQDARRPDPELAA